MKRSHIFWIAFLFCFSLGKPAYSVAKASPDFVGLLGDIYSQLHTNNDLLLGNTSSCNQELANDALAGLLYVRGEAILHGALLDPLAKAFRVLFTAAGGGLIIDVYDLSVLTYNSFYSENGFQEFAEGLAKMLAIKKAKIVLRRGSRIWREYKGAGMKALGKKSFWKSLGARIVDKSEWIETTKDVYFTSGFVDTKEDIVIEPTIDEISALFQRWWLHEKSQVKRGNEKIHYEYGSRCKIYLDATWDKNTNIVAIVVTESCSCKGQNVLKLKSGSAVIAATVKAVRTESGSELQPTVVKFELNGQCCNEKKMAKDILIDEPYLVTTPGTPGTPGTTKTPTSGKTPEEKAKEALKLDCQQKAGTAKKALLSARDAQLKELEDFYRGEKEKLKKKLEKAKEKYKELADRVRDIEVYRRNPVLDRCQPYFDKMERKYDEIRSLHELQMQFPKSPEWEKWEQEIKDLEEEIKYLDKKRKECRKKEKEDEKRLPELRAKRDEAKKAVDALEEELKNLEKIEREQKDRLKKAYDEKLRALEAFYEDCLKKKASDFSWGKEDLSGYKKLPEKPKDTLIGKPYHKKPSGTPKEEKGKVPVKPKGAAIKDKTSGEGGEMKVSILQVIPKSGNNPFDPEDPLKTGEGGTTQTIPQTIPPCNAGPTAFPPIGSNPDTF